MKRLFLLTKTLLIIALLGMGVNAWAVVNEDGNGRKQYVWNLGCEAKASVGGTGTTDYFLKTGESAYGDYSSDYGTSGNYDILKVRIYGGRCIYANSEADSDKGGGTVLAHNAGYLEFYAPVDGIVTLAGCYLDRATIENKSTKKSVKGNTYISVSAGNRIQVYVYVKNASTNSNAMGVEKIVLTENYYDETITNPSHSLSENTLTITPGVASWTAGGVAREATKGTSAGSTSQTEYPTVTTYYTTDGSTPTTGSSQYSEAIDISGIDVVKYYSVSASSLASEIKQSSVSVTVSSAGYATYVNNDYDLDFSATDIKAYKAQVNTTTGVITLTGVDNVPAGTPVILYKEGGAKESIPVMTGAATIEDNDLKAGKGVAVPTTDGAGNYNYVLDKQDEIIGFYKAANLTVPTNRAYLQTTYNVAGLSARGLRIVFAGDITSISEATPTVEAAKKEGKFFKDGKLFIFKNGMKFNAAGQQVK